MDDLERISVGVAHRNEAPVNGYWIRLPLLYPEERLLAVTKSPQIGMTAFALVRHEKHDVKRLQGRLIERQRTLDIADSQNNVVQHRSPSKHECGRYLHVGTSIWAISRRDAVNAQSQRWVLADTILTAVNDNCLSGDKSGIVAC